MILWLPLSIGAYFLNAVAAIVDKSLLKKAIPNPRVYAFFVGLLGLVGLVLAPFGMSIPSARIILISFGTGAIFVVALIFFFTALRRAEASRVVTFIGGIQPIGIFILAFLFLGEQLAPLQILAFALLVIGGIIISIGGGKPQATGHRPQASWVLFAIIGGLAFACFYVLTKYIFEQETFVNGFVWPRIGAGIAAALLLLDASVRKSIKGVSTGTGSKKTTVIFLAGQGAGALSFIVLHYAISLGSVTLINAIQGVQYVFVFLIAIILAKKVPRLLDEKMTPKIIVQKIAAIALIFIGIALLWV